MKYFFAVVGVVFFLGIQNVGAAETCQPQFPYQEGWMGGDSIYSVPLDGGKVVWLFGDSFVRDDELKTRSGSKMVSNSMALSTCSKDGSWQLHYYWGARGTGSPQPFFQPPADADKLWPEDGVLYKGTLYIFFDKIKNTNNGGLFGFEGIGTLVARISNPAEDPSRWHVDYLPLTESQTLFPAVSVSIKGSYLYLFSVLDGEAYRAHPLILLRIPLKFTGDPSHHLETYSKSGRWMSGAQFAEAKILIPEGGTEMTVRFHPAIGKWVAVQGAPGFPTSQVATRTSPTMEGPWSELKNVFRFPEMIPGTEGYDKDTFCYAVKEHGEFSDDVKREMTVTYACNSFQFGKQVNSLEIYKPRFIKVPLP